MDSFNQYSALNKPGLSTQHARYNTGNPYIYDGYVTGIGPAEILEGSVIVFIPSLKTHMKCYVSEGLGIGSGGSGKVSALATLDRVRIEFLRGDPNIGHVVGRIASNGALADKLKDTGEVPQPNTEYKTITLSPPGVTLIPEASDWGMAISYEVITAWR